MATVRQYFDNKIPVSPAGGVPPGGGFHPPRRSWHDAWPRFAKTLYLTLPNQLDRARDYRNRFIRAVQ